MSDSLHWVKTSKPLKIQQLTPPLRKGEGHPVSHHKPKPAADCPNNTPVHLAVTEALPLSLPRSQQAYIPEQRAHSLLPVKPCLSFLPKPADSPSPSWNSAARLPPASLDRPNDDLEKLVPDDHKIPAITASMIMAWPLAKWNGGSVRMDSCEGAIV